MKLSTSPLVSAWVTVRAGPVSFTKYGPFGVSTTPRLENGDYIYIYIYGKRKLREIDRRIRELSKSLDGAVVVDNAARPQVRFGATVTIHRVRGRARFRRPCVLAISAGQRRCWPQRFGDTVTLRAPRGPKRLEIVSVRCDDLR